MSFVEEIKRRKMFQVAAVYLIVAWLAVQVITSIEAPLGLPDWSDTLVIVLLAIGFPVTLVISWAFNLTPDGLVRDQGQTAAMHGRTIEYVLIGLLAMAVVWLLYRDIDSPDSAATTAPAGVTVEPTPSTATRPGVLPHSVAVLPFASLSLEPEDEFFAQGIHDEVLNQLENIGDLSVIARQSVLRYAKSDKSIREIADELNVETIMEGTIRYGKERIRLTAQLIDPATGAHLWSNTYDREFDVESVFDIESDIATQIAEAMQAKFSPAEQARIAKPLTASTEAWALYLRAMSLISGGLNPWESVETVERFHALLDQAIAIDPGFATAHAVKAVEYAMSIMSQRPIGRSRPPAESERLAIESAERALAIDPDVGLAYMALGVAQTFALHGAEALRSFEAALALDPNDVEILDDFARLNQRLGRDDEAIRQMRRVVQLSPDQIGGLAWQLYVAGRLDEAADAYREAEAVRAPNADDLSTFADIEAIRGDYATAREYLRLAEDPEFQGPWASSKPMVAARIAYVYGRIGDADGARGSFERFESLAQEYRTGDSSWALAFLAVGEVDQALERLRAAADGAYVDGLFLEFSRNVYQDPVLERPEFVEVRERMRFRD
jgi:TolB-like protein/Flp pilus assembly protein TadD